MQDLYRKLRKELMARLALAGEVTDKQIKGIITELVIDAGKECYMTLEMRSEISRELFYSVRRLDVLQDLIDDRQVTEIMVNGPDCIFVERAGKLTRVKSRFSSPEKLDDVIQQIVGKVNRVVNESSPIVDARLPDGSRVNVVLPPISLDGAVVTIRKFPEPITMEKLIGYGSITPEAAAFLKKLVQSGYNIFISGGTGSGKTTFLNALSAFIPDDERVITIEDSAELQLKHIRNLVRLETRAANPEGDGAVTISDLIRASLRMNPDRIVVGEVRGAEALDMLQAMNTGHDGSLSTGHGNNPRDMLARLETMTLCAANLPLPAIRGQIAGALDIMVHLGRLRDRSRRVLSITEVGGIENGEIQLHELYSFREDRSGGARRGRVTGRLEQVGELENRDKLLSAGLEL